MPTEAQTGKRTLTPQKITKNIPTIAQYKPPEQIDTQIDHIQAQSHNQQMQPTTQTIIIPKPTHQINRHQISQLQTSIYQKPQTQAQIQQNQTEDQIILEYPGSANYHLKFREVIDTKNYTDDDTNYGETDSDNDKYLTK